MITPASSIFGIIPAAGRSRRMGSAKQLLDIHGRPMLGVVIESLAAADIFGVIAVTHHAIANSLTDLRNTRVDIVYNENEMTEMIDSIRIGLRAWRDRQAFNDIDGFLVCPGDQPGISTADFNACIAAFRETPDCIVIASRGGKRGHPIIFPTSLAAFVESAACDEGLNALPHAMPKRIRLVPCSSSGVVLDIDTPDDYAAS